MNTTDLVHYVSTGERLRTAAAPPVRLSSSQELAAPTRLAILQARQFLLHEQRDDGSWCGRATGDASLASQWILLLAYLGEEHSEEADAAACAVERAQLPAGGWPRFPGGPADVSISVQAYSALKLAGNDPASERMSKARDAIRRLGGADAADPTTRYFLALLGQIGYDCCPVVAPEEFLFDNPQRRDLAPLSVFWSHRPVRDVGLAAGVRELFIDRPAEWAVASAPGRRWVDRILACCERRGWTPLRRRALDRVEGSLLADVALNQITRLDFHELVLRLIAIDTLGHAAGTKPFDTLRDRLNTLAADDQTLRPAGPQLRANLVVNTALALKALRTSGISLRPIIGPSVTGWLAQLQRPEPARGTMELAWLVESLRAASHDLAETEQSLPPDIQLSGELCSHEPSVRLTALQRRARRLAEQFVLQLVDRQNADGGWAPYAGADAPSAPDATGAVLEALADCGGARVRQAVDRAVAYLRSAQRADGSWSSATGVRYVHGTSLAVCGLVAAGLTMEDEEVALGVNWLLVHQQPFGGWGELPATIDEFDDYAPEPATATQSAWALRALIVAGLSGEPSVRRGVQFLIDSQADDGTWNDAHFTLRDSSNGRWFRHDLHATAWPLMALSQWSVAAANEESTEPMLRLVGAPADDPT